MQLLDSCPLPQAQFASLSILLQLHLNNDEDGNNETSANDDDGYHPTIVKNVSSEEIESTIQNDVLVEMVECKTTSNGSTTKQVPMYPKGMTIYYKNNFTNTKTPAVVLDVHLDDLMEPYYTIRLEDGREKQTDNAHLRLDMVPTEETDEGDDAYSLDSHGNNVSGPNNNNKNNGMEADKSAGPPNPAQRTTSLQQHAILKESLTVISPLTLLPEAACKRSLDSLHHCLMEEFGMQDDFMGIGSNKVEGGSNGDADKENKKIAIREEEDEEDDNTSARRSSRVRFQEDTKKGAAQDPSTNAPSNAANNEQHPTVPFGSMLPVKIYQPPSHHLNCSLGLTMFYVAVYVEDVSQISAEGKIGITNFRSGKEWDEKSNNTARERDSIEAFYNCASVLLPGISLSSLTNSVEGLHKTAGSSSSVGQKKKQGGVILLTVGTTGPAYDIFGASSVIATLPERLREGMTTLASVDTTPKEEVQSAGNHQQQQQQLEQLQLQQTNGTKKKKSKGKNGTPTSRESAAAAAVQPTAQSALLQQRVSYDAAYFQRLYMALLATLIDDEDGLLRDHDEIIPTTAISGSFHPTASGPLLSSTAAVVGSYIPSLQQRPPPSLTGLTESTTGLLASQNVTSSGTAKKKRFTFSRKKSGKSKNNLQGEYESGEWISGGDPAGSASPVAGGGVGAEDTSRMNNAEIVRRTAQHLEVLSLVEDDMDLPKYSHAGGGSGRRVGQVPSSPLAAKSPRRAHKAGSASGRFGRLPVMSDLSGFEYRPPFHPQPPSPSVAGTVSTVGNSTDDNSVRSGDDSATITSRYTVGSQSSIVPTLSKSKRDSSKTSVRSRFLQRKKKGNKSVAATSSPAAKSGIPSEKASQQQNKTAKKPPLFPQHQQQLPLSQQHQVYDPFSMDEEEEDNYHEQESVKSERTSEGARSIASMSTKEDTVQQTPVSPMEGTHQQTPVTLEERSAPLSPPAPQVVGTISRSFSEESEGVMTEQSAASIMMDEQSAASIMTTESAASIMTERADASTAPKEPAATEEADIVEPTRYLDVGLALNEDLTCEYKRSKLSSLTVEGTVQVRVKTRYEEVPAPHQQQQPPIIPFFLVFQDHSGHIKALQENKKFVENVTHEADVAQREFTYTIKVPREDEYFPVVRYKCGSSLRPVPIRVQSRVRTQGKFARIALQISSNPQNPSDLVHLTIIMSVPNGVRGDTLQCNPPGGVWNEAKRVVLWCVSELGGGEKFQLQSIFEIEEELLLEWEGNGGTEDLAEKLEFPVLSRCQCSGAQLSDVTLEVSDVSDMFPAEVSKTVVQRFRVSHKESNR